MNTEQSITAIKKALEVWSLQNLCDGAIMLTFLALALVAARGYLEGLKARLSLRVAIETWDTLIDLARISSCSWRPSSGSSSPTSTSWRTSRLPCPGCRWAWP